MPCPLDAFWQAFSSTSALGRSSFLRSASGRSENSRFDCFIEDLCKPYSSSSTRGRSSPPPGRYFRMLLVGYFEGLDSERGIGWRCADSLSLRELLLLSTRETVPDHSWLSKTRSRLPLEVHVAVFAWVLKQLGLGSEAAGPGF
jgi:hypothetical protein